MTAAAARKAATATRLKPRPAADRPVPHDPHPDATDGWRYIIVRHRLDPFDNPEVEVDALGTFPLEAHTVLSLATAAVWGQLGDAVVTVIGNN